MVAQQKQEHQLRSASAAAQITSKAITVLATATTAKGDVIKGTSSSASRALPPPMMRSASRCSFLQRCFFCHRELADCRDIYIYRGERAFCSEECRYRHILAEVDDDEESALLVGVVATDCSSQLRHQAVSGGFTF